MISKSAGAHASILVVVKERWLQEASFGSLETT
jgi:hypothetical protein